MGRVLVRVRVGVRVTVRVEVTVPVRVEVAVRLRVGGAPRSLATAFPTPRSSLAPGYAVRVVIGVGVRSRF